MMLCAPIGLCMPGGNPVRPDSPVARSTDHGILRERRAQGALALIAEAVAVLDTRINRSAALFAETPTTTP